jgi:hypothetical protein
MCWMRVGPPTRPLSASEHAGKSYNRPGAAWGRVVGVERYGWTSSAFPTPWTRAGRRGSELTDRGTLASPADPPSISELKPTRVDKKIGRVRFFLYSSRHPESASARDRDFLLGELFTPA